MNEDELREKRSRTGRKSKQKGKRVERELANILKDLGSSDARRTAQYNGLKGDSDVIAELTLPSFHLESKGDEKLVLKNAIDQAVTDSQGQKIPVVCHKKNRTPFYVTMRIEDWYLLARAYEIQLTVIGGGTGGRAETGDGITLTGSGLCVERDNELCRGHSSKLSNS